jgi:hypothetical protein
MLKSALATLVLLAAAPAFAQEPASTQVQAGKPTGPLTVDSTLRDLILDPRTRPVIDKHMPGFADRMINEPELAEMFGGVTFAGLQHDPHVRGMTPEALTKIGAEIADAQKPPQS